MHVTQRWLAGSIILLCLIAIPVSIIFAGAGKSKSIAGQDSDSIEEAMSDYLDNDHVAVVRLTGLIADEEDGFSLMSSGESAASVLRQLRKAVKNNHVRAVLLRIESPGGTVSTSQEIAAEIKSLQNNQKPVVVSMGDVGASGGYYVACGADKIVADPGTITGSIGVIMHSLNLKGLSDKLGLQPQVIKSGRFKDIGSPYREMTPQERTILQDLISDAYDQFVTAIAQGRHMPISEVKKLADGRIYSGRQALKLGLIDKLGGYTVALSLLQDIGKERFHWQEELPVKEFRAKNLIHRLLESALTPADFRCASSVSTTFNNLALNALMPEFIKAKYDHQPLWLMP